MTRDAFVRLVKASLEGDPGSTPSEASLARWYDRYVEETGEPPTVAAFQKRREAYLKGGEA